MEPPLSQGIPEPALAGSVASSLPPDEQPRHNGLGSPPPGAADDALDRVISHLIDQTTQPFLAIDLDGRITRVNRACVELLGYSAEELLGMTVQQITPPEWMATTEKALAQLQALGRAGRYEKEYIRKDGQRISVELAADLFRDEQGKPRGYYAFVTDIGERKRTERALRESEERFRRLYDEAPFGYHEIDTEGTILIVNRTECEMLGYTREEMIGRPIFDFLIPSQREESRRAVAARVRGERADMGVERVYRTKDGREIPVYIENRLTYDDRGRVVAIRSTVQDISARKQAEAALVTSERRLRALFEGIEDAVFVHDLEGRILDANPAASRKLGYTHEELLRLTTRDIDDPEFAAGFEDRLRQQLATGHLSCEGRHRTKDGRVIPVDINTSTIQLENRTVILAVIRDITERKALEETRRRFAEAQSENARQLEQKNRELIRSEARYRRLTEGCLDAVVVADASGRIALFNPAAERTFGYAAGEVLGQPLTVLMPERYREMHDGSFRRYLETRRPRIVGRTVELRGLRKDGEEFPMELSLNAVDVDGEIQFIGSIRDLTERQRMRDMLMRSEKLASIGLLSAGVAHEINNPLSYIANNLAVLERDLKGILEMMAAYESTQDTLRAHAPDVLQAVHALSDDLDWPYVRDNLGRMLARTREGVQRVANIVQGLRSLARTTPPKMEPAALSDLLAGALEMIQGRLRRKGITIELQAQESLPKVPCDASKISQVLLNLLINAMQAIEAANRPEGHIAITIRQEGDEQILTISDNGCGIDPEALPHLFDPFYTTKPVGEGTGLGLSISHEIITGHGGRIEVESQPGQGTCFRISLPIRETVASRQRAVGRSP